MNKIKKNINQRYLFKKNEHRRLILKTITNSLKLNEHIRWKTYQFFFFNSNNNSLCRIKNICTITGRSRGIFRFFKVSRIQLKKLASQGFLPGFSKYSW